MYCLLHLAASLCLFDTSHIELRADISSQVAGNFTYVSRGNSYGGAHVGTIELSAGSDLTNEVSIRYGIRHTSLADTSHDRGEERAFIGIIWRPFRR
jgi:hypothetical protein